MDAYVIAYEVTHLLYHLPEALVGDSRLVRVLKEHHARHHDPRLMQKWNFNVTVPLADWVLKTIAPKRLVDGIKGRAAVRVDADGGARQRPGPEAAARGAP